MDRQERIDVENLKYYKDLNHDFLLAYEKSTEFFVVFRPENNKWEDCNISFSKFRHDYEFIEVGKEEVIKKTSGNLPLALFQQYSDLLKRNSGV